MAQALSSTHPLFLFLILCTLVSRGRAIIHVCSYLFIFRRGGGGDKTYVINDYLSFPEKLSFLYLWNIKSKRRTKVKKGEEDRCSKFFSPFQTFFGGGGAAGSHLDVKGLF